MTYLNDDGLSIEPEYYMPVIPMVLVNGSEGIGTGWSCTIQNHDPREIIDNIRKMITGEEPEEMHPHFYGYTGEVSFHCLIFHSFRGRKNSHLSLLDVATDHS